MTDNNFNIRWTEFDVPQAVVNRARTVYDEYGKLEVDFCIGDDRDFNGLIDIDQERLDVNFIYRIEGEDYGLGSDYMLWGNGVDMLDDLGELYWTVIEAAWEEWSKEFIRRYIDGR